MIVVEQGQVSLLAELVSSSLSNLDVVRLTLSLLLLRSRNREGRVLLPLAVGSSFGRMRVRKEVDRELLSLLTISVEVSYLEVRETPEV